MAPFPIRLMILLGLFCLAIGILLLIAAATPGPQASGTHTRAAGPKAPPLAPSGRR